MCERNYEIKCVCECARKHLLLGYFKLPNSISTRQHSFSFSSSLVCFVCPLLNNNQHTRTHARTQLANHSSGVNKWSIVSKSRNETRRRAEQNKTKQSNKKNNISSNKISVDWYHPFDLCM